MQTATAVELIQSALWCKCGGLLWRHGLCATCYRRARLSRERFDGKRDEIIVRDGSYCVLCAGENIIVHHRPRGFITLCRGHHAQIHHKRRMFVSGAANPIFAQLWLELRKGIALQLELPLIEPGRNPRSNSEQQLLLPAEVLTISEQILAERATRAP